MSLCLGKRGCCVSLSLAVRSVSKVCIRWAGALIRRASFAPAGLMLLHCVGNETSSVFSQLAFGALCCFLCIFTCTPSAFIHISCSRLLFADSCQSLPCPYACKHTTPSPQKLDCCSFCEPTMTWHILSKCLENCSTGILHAIMPRTQPFDIKMMVVTMLPRQILLSVHDCNRHQSSAINLGTTRPACPPIAFRALWHSLRAAVQIFR